MKLFKYLIIFSCLPAIAFAQRKNDNNVGFKISPAFELMRSTHSNLFYAPSLKANYLFENGWEPGIGIEYSTTPVHHDNGFVLRKIHFLPVFANLKYNFNTKKIVKLYAETSLGYSFNKYDRATDQEPHKQRKIKEGGVYFYTGLGTKYALSEKADIFFAVGFKGYKFSTNNLDINPHGVSFTLGFSLF
ncbi:hypothetical protein ABIB40_003189 [Pedobacter sp. UYP30]|uniref:outer membrane beta-barrel protein n=1 Tax=Pedobacter sp. UYP30 TaxID=1756400 RepID=UPI00339A9C5D